MHSAIYAVASGPCPSVRLSVTILYCVKTPKRVETLSNMKYPQFEGHMTPNEDEYQKSVRLKFRYCLEVS